MSKPIFSFSKKIIFILFGLFNITFLTAFNDGATNRQWKQINQLYEQGSFCDLPPLVEKYYQKYSINSKKWQAGKLMSAAIFLELEQWEQARKSLDDIDERRIMNRVDKGNFYLLKARLAEKEEKIGLADSLYLKVLTEYAIDQNSLQTKALAYYGLFLYETDEFQKAEIYIKRATAQSGKPISVVAKANKTLGYLYSKQSKNILANTTLKKAKAIWEENGWIKHPDYALFLNDYAIAKLTEGKVKVADSLLVLSMNLNDKNCSLLSIKGYNRSAKAAIQFYTADFETAIPLFQEAIDIFEGIDQHREVATALFKQGEAYFKLDSVVQAENCFRQALVNSEKFYGGKNNLQKANAIRGLGSIYGYNWKDKEADSLFTQAIDLYAKTIGKETAEYATAISYLAWSKEFQEDYTAALDLFKQTEHLDTLLLGAYHPNYLVTLYCLARCYSRVDSLDLSHQYYEKANALQLTLLENYFANFDEATLLKYRLRAMGNFDVFYSHACFADQKKLLLEIININLATKNRVLDYSRQTQQTWQTLASEATQNLHNQWLANKKLLTELSLKSREDQRQLGLSIDSIQLVKNQMERQLAQQAASYLNNEQINFEAIREKLKADEAAIDFFNFYVADDYGTIPDSILYFATIIRKDWDAPKLIPLLDKKELRHILQLSSHYTLNAEIGHLLYQKIWQPLASFLTDVKTVHLSPDGYLHQVAFGGLFTDENAQKMLMDEFDIYYYSNLRDFAMPKQKSKIAPSILLMGNPDYDKRLLEQPIDFQDGHPFIGLPGTKNELKIIEKTLQAKGFEIKTFQKQNAEESLLRKNISQVQPAIIHLATHGYFYKKDTSSQVPPTLQNRIKSSNNALLRSGIVLAGINENWLRDTDGITQNDGLLCAAEVANLNLSKTQLVVLSACNTGKGEVLDGEGVFGLQRAFKAAGVPNLLISLWKIPDQLTAELMGYFYSFLADNNSPQIALQKAQNKMRKKYKNPYDWAGFVMFN